jgi:methionine synthase I (cobalamin-dependent)
MSLSFTAAIEILDRAKEKMREAQAIQSEVKDKLEEAETIQRRAADKIDEARNDLKEVYALGPIGGVAEILTIIEAVEQGCHHDMVVQIKATMESAENMSTNEMEQVISAIEELKGN